MTFKGKIHVPTEQYGFVEIDIETDSMEGMLEMYKVASESREGNRRYTIKDIQDMFMDQKLNKVVDKYLISNTLSEGDYNDRHPIQKLALQVIKRAFKRIKE